MAEWLGHLIANWPVWAVVIVLIIVGIGWILYGLFASGESIPFERKEWWQDRERRLQHQSLTRRHKPEQKKG